MMTWRFVILIALLLGVIFIEARVYSRVESWRYLDSLYFTVVTVTTIGYGDLVPETDAGKIITLFFSLFCAVFPTHRATF